MKSLVPTEAEVQKSCLSLLAARGILAWRSNSRVFKVPGKGGRDRLMRAGLGKGSPDIVGILPGGIGPDRLTPGGRFFALEVKRPGECPTPDQLAWLTMVNHWGAFAFWVDSTANLVLVLDVYDACLAKGHLAVIEFDATGNLTIDRRTAP